MLSSWKLSRPSLSAKCTLSISLAGAKKAARRALVCRAKARQRRHPCLVPTVAKLTHSPRRRRLPNPLSTDHKLSSRSRRHVQRKELSQPVQSRSLRSALSRQPMPNAMHQSLLAAIWNHVLPVLTRGIWSRVVWIGPRTQRLEISEVAGTLSQSDKPRSSAQHTPRLERWHVALP